MLRVLPYGATKSALESMSAVWAHELKDTGITVNVLVPGGPTDTPFISDAAGWARSEMLRPEIMGAPALLAHIRRVGRLHRPPHYGGGLGCIATGGPEAAREASRGIGWPELAAQTAWWPKGNP